MGIVCCCLRGEWEDFANPNSSLYRNCICFRCSPQNFLHVYNTVFNRGRERVPVSYSQGTSVSAASLDDSFAEIYRSPPRPIPYDAYTRCVQLQQDRSRSEKGSDHINEETEPLRMSKVEELKLLNNPSKCYDLTCEAGSDEYNMIMLSAENSKPGFSRVHASSEEEDECPTCLDEYTPENPSISTKCSHQFHLGCIYEWMERSETCPICCKVMAFDEMA